jgi:dihydrofolate synthase / folylpolyglutamate synthase
MRDDDMRDHDMRDDDRGDLTSESAHRSGSSQRLSSGGPRIADQAQAERHLRSLELFGMRFGLDRMRRMMTALGSPQLRFDTIHVVGTNGKTSTTRMIAAILERDGLRTGSYTSPHLMSYTERLQVGERDISSDAFAGAVARAAWAAERVNRTLAEDDHVTQFELLTAAAFSELAERGVEVAVIEAGLGGRYDATSVIDSQVTVLTNVGLEHTRWLGPTIRDIAEEKLAVVQPGTVLVLGADLAPEALSVAERVAGERGARMTPVAAGGSLAPLRAAGAFQQRNFALARAAAEAYLNGAAGERAQIAGGGARGAAHERAVRDAAAATAVAGRLQLIEGEPPIVLDGAHNPDAIAALVESLPAILHRSPTALVLGVLEDKDAAGMLRMLLEVCERAWFTAPPSDRALSPAALQSLARQLGFDAVTCEPLPWRALEAAREWAARRGGAVLVTGSVYLVGDLLGRLEHASVPLGESQVDVRGSTG